MKFRPYAFVVVALATMVASVALVSPARAAAPVVGDVTVTGQAQGTGKTWEVKASWTASSGESLYEVQVANGAGTSYGKAETTDNTATVVAAGLTAGAQYFVKVRPISPEEGTWATSAAFTAIAIDTEAPTAKVALNRTTGYIGLDEATDMTFGPAARFKLTLSNVADNKTAAAKVDRKVEAGAPNGVGRVSRAGDVYTISYNEPGSYTPRVKLTDEFGNVRDIAVGPLSVRADTGAPKIAITKPKKPGKKGSWKVIRGTASDSGTGVQAVVVGVMQQRGRLWYPYDFSKGKWLEGMTKKKAAKKMEPAIMELPGATWKTPKIRGLKAGKLLVQAVAVDAAINFKLAKATQKVS